MIAPEELPPGPADVDDGESEENDLMDDELVGGLFAPEFESPLLFIPSFVGSPMSDDPDPSLEGSFSGS